MNAARNDHRQTRRHRVRSRALAAWPSFALFASLSACSSGECPTLEACDIRDGGCQRHTAKVLGCLRGSGSTVPEITVVSAEAFIAEQVAEAEANPEPPEDRNLRQGLSLFGLMDQDAGPAGVEREYWTNVAAFFSDTDQRVTILDRGEPLDEPASVNLLLHELVHALQSTERADAGIDCCDTYDEALAFRALLEGEAELYQDLSMVYGYGDDPDELDWDDIYARFQSSAWADLRSTRNAFELAPLYFPYAYGGDYVNRAFRAGGNAAVHPLLRDGPRSTRQLLFGYGAAPPDDSSWQENPDEVGYPLFAPEWELVAAIHLGALLFEVFESLQGAGRFGDSGYLGDVLTIFAHRDSEDVVGVWRVRFDSAERAATLAPRFASNTLSATADARDLILLSTRDASLTESLARDLGFGPVPESEPEMGDDAPGRVAPIACALRPASY